MTRITEKTKFKEKRGTGEGADYKPWILAREFGSEGTSCVFNDWKHGRQIQCLSQGEAKAYRMLRWQDDVIDIKEQFPLDLKLTRAVARQLGLPHPHSRNTVMTTDFLVTCQNPNGTRYLKAYNVKKNKKALDAYAMKNFLIESMYWQLNGVHLEVIYSDDLDKTMDTNIRECTRYYDPALICDPVDIIKHLIARKRIRVDMTAPIDYHALVKEYLKNKPLLK